MFTNLHTHTEYSLLDGLSRIPQLMERAKSLGQEALAITDHGAMYGVIEFYKEAEKHGIKPIIGVEAYVAPGARQSRDPREKSAYYHLGLLARNEQGFKNLMALTTLANLEGYYYKPRMDKEILAKYGKGIIALTGCPSGELFKALQDGRDADAKAVAGFYKDVFDDVLVEIQDHPDAKGDLRGMLDLVNPRLIEFSRATGLPLVATNDSHYTYPEDAQIHEILLCIGTNATINDPKRFRLEGDSYYLMGEEEMRRIPLFQEHPEAVDNTQRVVDACDLKLEFGRVQLPDPELPPGMTPQEYLTRVCFEGLKRRYGAEAAGQWPLSPNPQPPTSGDKDEVRRRLEYELHVVQVTGFAAYILIVAEIARAAEERGIPMGVRGSAAASILLYTLGVTEIDPIATRLVFERFLNVERREMPDVDMDFADDRREEMIRWAAQRYGHDRVAQIITFGTMGAKAAIRDVGRALGMALSETDRVARLVPTALHMTIDRALAENVEFKQLYDADGQVRMLVDSAKKLEGVARHAGTHAAGVLISRDPLIDVVPLQKAARGDDNALPVTQFEMNTVGEVGLLKMDFLGLSNLTILGKAVDLIKQTKGITLDLKTLPDGDPKTYDLLGKGETFAVFQLESPPMRRAIRDLKPASIAELSAMVALYRPGPMQHIPRFCDSKHGRVQVTYPHPALANILDETYGVIVYQDQVLFILRQFAGYTMGEADKVRKAMGKKIAEMMAEQRVKFVKGAKNQGYTEEDAIAVFDLIEPFAGYAFNKCLVSDTVITEATTGEQTTIGALYAEPHPFTIHALGDDGKLRPRAVADVMANGTRPVFELRTAHGHRITATDNHPFRTLGGWTNLADLKPGDLIAAPRRLPVESSENWPHHEIVVLAGLLSEGNTCHPGSLYFYNNDSALIDDFVRSASCFADTAARVTTRENGRLVVCLNTGRDRRFHAGMRPWNARAGTAVAEAPARSGVWTWAEDLGITWRKATEKRIPDGVFRLCDEDIELFLGRLWSGDGFIASGANTVPFYATSSVDLAYGVQALLLRLGIVSGVHEKRFAYREEQRFGWTVHLVGEDAIEVFARRILPHVIGRTDAIVRLRDHLQSTTRGMTATDIIPADVRRWVDAERQARGLTWNALEALSGVSVKEFYGNGSQAKRGFRRATIRRLGETLSSERLLDIAGSDVFWDRVVAIEPKGEQPTYDLTVDTDHNFVADGLIVHNSHSVCYGTIAYQTAYLKANYAAEYMTAVLALADSHPAGFAERVGAAVAECAKLGIGVLSPDVNHSEVSFSIEGGEAAPSPTPNPQPPTPAQAIRFGLATIKNVGEGAVEGIVAARREGGPYSSLEDFCRRATLKNFNKRMLESLIKAGALDSFGYNRTTLVANIDRVASLITREQRLKDTGQATMFDLFGDEVPVPLPALELDMLPDAQGETLAWEKDLLGVYVSDHPFKRAHPALAGRITAVISEVTPEMAGREVTIAGMVNTVRTLLTKAGKTFVAATVEDLSGSVEVTCWPDTYERTREYWQQGKILLLTVRIKQRDERLDVTVNDAGLWDEVTGSVKGGLSAPPPPAAVLPNGASNGTASGPRPVRDTGWSDDWPDGDAGPSDADLAELEALSPSGPAFTSPDLTPQPPPLRGERAPVGASANGNAALNGAAALSPTPNTQHPTPAKRNPYARPEPTPIPTEDRARRLLRIAIRETDDEAGDRRRLNELVQVLRSLPGPDEVRLTLKTNHDDITLSLGTALVTDGIDQRLSPILTGWGEMSIEPPRAG